MQSTSMTMTEGTKHKNVSQKNTWPMMLAATTHQHTLHPAVTLFASEDSLIPHQNQSTSVSILIPSLLTFFT